ncbi:MAG TPA: VWA domain-containing protein, partial [Jiangellaceae bacterium]|nr:VWA domain-containing protein [Jiangellaceae bacterium]
MPGGLVSEDLSISVDGSTVIPAVVPMMSRSLSVALVIDAAAETPAELVEAVQTGATDFLLRLPEGARTAVVTSGGDPQIAAPLSAERADALSALSALRPAGPSSMAEAVLLAADELVTAPEGPRTIIVFANSSDVGSPSVEQVTEAISDSTALIYVIQTSEDNWWSRVVDGAGGAVLRTDQANVVQSYGDLATALEEQYLVTFQAPGELPAVAEVATGPGEVESSAVVPLPAPDTAADPAAQPGERPADRESGPPTGVLGRVLLGLGLIVLVITGFAIFRANWRTSAASSPVAAGDAGPPEAGTNVPPSPLSAPDVPDAVQVQDEPAGISPSPPAVVPPRRKSPRASLSAAVQGRMSAQQALSSALDQQARKRSKDEQQRHPAQADDSAVRHTPDDATPTEDAAGTSDDLPPQAPPSATSPQPAEPPAPADEPDEPDEQHPAEEDGQDATTVLTGSGNAVIELPKPPSGPAAVRISGNQAARYFGVQTLGTDRALVMTIEPFDGVRMLDW